MEAGYSNVALSHIQVKNLAASREGNSALFCMQARNVLNIFNTKLYRQAACREGNSALFHKQHSP